MQKYLNFKQYAKQTPIVLYKKVSKSTKGKKSKMAKAGT